MVKRIIPGNMSPWECNVNGVKYVYPAGTEQYVPAEVAAIIDAYWEKQEVDYPETGISFNDLRDRPFGESTEVLFDQRVELEPTEDADWISSFIDEEHTELLEAGKTYTVTYNGVSYKCVPVDVDGDGVPDFMGNLVLFGGEDTGEPFLVNVVPGNNDVLGEYISLEIISLNADTSATVKIEKSVIHTIDPKYLPSGGGGKVIYNWNSNADTLTDESGNTVTVEQAKNDMFNVVIDDRFNGGFRIPYIILFGDDYVQFIVNVFGEETTITVGKMPK